MIQDILPRYQEVANGSKTAFTFPFDVLRNEFIEVYVGSDRVTSGWTLSASEKTITFGVAPVAGALITIYRNIPVEWLNSVGTASSTSIDEAVTYLVAQIQTIKEGLSRAIQTRVIDTDKGEDLSDDYINSLGQATALYGECETLLAQIQVEGVAINALYEEFVERINNFVSTDPNLTNPSDEVVPSQKAVKTYVDNKDSQVVHKTGSETITGAKTFANTIIASKGNGVQINGTEHNYTMRSSGSTAEGCGLFLDNVPANMAFNADSSKITIGSDAIKAHCVTPTENSTSSKQIDTVGARNTQINAILSALYPVGSLYITTNNSATCPLASLISGSSWSLVAADKALWTSNRNANTTINAGLPNITGRYNRQCLLNVGVGTEVGALYTTWNDNDVDAQYAAGSSGGHKRTIAFDASRSNSIYGNSSTVQPPAYRVNVWRRTA